MFVGVGGRELGSSQADSEDLLQGETSRPALAKFDPGTKRLMPC